MIAAMGLLKSIFWKGLATLLPVLVTGYAVYWVVITVERLLRPLVPDPIYVPGSGLLLAVVAIAAFGALMHFFLFEWLVNLADGLIRRIPLVKSVYNALHDLFSYLGQRPSDDLSRVVLVNLHGTRLIGFVTNSNFTAAPPDDSGARVCVYLPMSYQIGGYMAVLPADALEPLDIPVEDAMRLVLTAGVKSA